MQPYGTHWKKNINLKCGKKCVLFFNWLLNKLALFLPSIKSNNENFGKHLFSTAKENSLKSHVTHSNICKYCPLTTSLSYKNLIVNKDFIFLQIFYYRMVYWAFLLSWSCPVPSCNTDCIENMLCSLYRRQNLNIGSCLADASYITDIFMIH